MSARTILATLSLLLLGVATEAAAQGGPPESFPMPNIPRLKQPFPTGPQPPTEVSPAGYTRASGRALALQAVTDAINQKYDATEKTYVDLVTRMPRASDGTWVIDFFQTAFDNQFRGPSDDHVKFWLVPWERDRPQSAAVAVVQAIRWQRRAWEARGGNYTSGVPGEAMQLFRDRLLLASKALEKSESLGPRSPTWYWVALIIAGSSGQSGQQFDALFEDAVAKFPLYQPLYYTRMNYLLPQWGGSFDAVDQFVERSVQRTKAVDGEAFYAWLYVDIVRKIDGNLFETTQARWPRMKRGFEDMVQRHPDPYNRNLFAAYACLARDRETAARLMSDPAIKYLDGFVEGITTEGCRKFALDPA
jgi:hypothetical protein